jgi:hypothetical protein
MTDGCLTRPPIGGRSSSSDEGGAVVDVVEGNVDREVVGSAAL